MGREKSLYQCLSATLIFFMALAPALAQSIRPVEARLRVTVVDQAGAAIPNAQVTINKQRQTLVTGKLGEANFSGIVPGKYQMQITADGFAPLIVKDVNLRAGANNLVVKLDVANVKE